MASHNYADQHVWSSIKFYLFAVGDVTGITIKARTGNTNVLLFGLVIVIMAVAAVVAHYIRRDEHGGSPVGVALICFGLLFAASITQAWSFFGYWGASASRYRTFDLMFLVGIYLTLLGRPTLLADGQEPSAHLADETGPGSSRWRIRSSGAGSIVESALPVARWIAAVLISVQILVGFPNGIQGVHGEHKGEALAVQVSRNPDHTSNAIVRYFLDPYLSAPYIRQQVHSAERLHLSFFADGGNP